MVYATPKPLSQFDHRNVSVLNWGSTVEIFRDGKLVQVLDNNGKEQDCVFENIVLQMISKLT